MILHEIQLIKITKNFKGFQFCTNICNEMYFIDYMQTQKKIYSVSQIYLNQRALRCFRSYLHRYLILLNWYT